MKIRPLGAELFQADGQTDVTKLIVSFRNFVNALKNYRVLHFGCHHIDDDVNAEGEIEVE
jgi:hypothetical protein